MSEQHSVGPRGPLLPAGWPRFPHLCLGGRRGLQGRSVGSWRDSCPPFSSPLGSASRNWGSDPSRFLLRPQEPLSGVSVSPSSPSVCFGDCLCLSPSLCLCVSLHLSFSNCLCLYFSICLPPSLFCLYVSLHLSFYLCFSPSLCLSLCASISLFCLCFSFYVSVSISISLSLSPHLFLSLCISLSLSFSISPGSPLAPSLSLCLPLSSPSALPAVDPAHQGDIDLSHLSLRISQRPRQAQIRRRPLSPLLRILQ